MPGGITISVFATHLAMIAGILTPRKHSHEYAEVTLPSRQITPQSRGPIRLCSHFSMVINGESLQRRFDVIAHRAARRNLRIVDYEAFWGLWPALSRALDGTAGLSLS